MSNNIQNIVDSISNYKLQRIVNKSLFKDNVISVNIYEQVDLSLLEKIETLTNELEMSSLC